MTSTLYGYWRSSAAYRVRIALNLKQIDYRSVPVNLRAGEQREQAYNQVNPQGLVPFYDDGEVASGQSLAIIEYLEELYPNPPLLPSSAARRAHVRSLAQLIACDIHPLNNLRILQYLKNELGLQEEAANAWARRWIEHGFAALEKIARAEGARYVAGNAVSLADVCLVPQLYNARRVGTDLARFPGLLEIERRLQELPAFMNAQPEMQEDAVA